MNLEITVRSVSNHYWKNSWSKHETGIMTMRVTIIVLHAFNPPMKKTVVNEPKKSVNEKKIIAIRRCCTWIMIENAYCI